MNENVFVFTLVIGCRAKLGCVFGQKALAKCLIGIIGKIDLIKSRNLTQIHMEHFRRNYFGGKFQQTRIILFWPI